MKTKLFALLICLTTGFTMFVTPTRAASVTQAVIPKNDAVALGQALTTLGTVLNQISGRLNARDRTITARSGEINSSLAGIRGNLVSINGTLIALSGGGGPIAQKSLPKENPAVQPTAKNVAEPVAENVDSKALISDTAPAPGTITVVDNSPGRQMALASDNFDMNKIIWPSGILVLIFGIALWLRKRDKEDAFTLASLKRNIRDVSTALVMENMVVEDDLHSAPVAQAANIGQPHT